MKSNQGWGGIIWESWQEAWEPEVRWCFNVGWMRLWYHIENPQLWDYTAICHGGYLARWFHEAKGRDATASMDKTAMCSKNLQGFWETKHRVDSLYLHHQERLNHFIQTMSFLAKNCTHWIKGAIYNIIYLTNNNIVVGQTVMYPFLLSVSVTPTWATIILCSVGVVVFILILLGWLRCDEMWRVEMWCDVSILVVGFSDADMGHYHTMFCWCGSFHTNTAGMAKYDPTTLPLLPAKKVLQHQQYITWTEVRFWW